MSRRQKGYALTETLIAAVIAAGVAASTASMAFSASRLSSASATHTVLLTEAQNIAARLRTDEPIADIKNDYPAWSLNIINTDRDNRIGTLAKPIAYRIQFERDQTFEFEIVTVKP